jgi:amidase
VICQFSRADAVVTPTLALAPRTVGWFSADDPALNFAQQVQYTPFTSLANVTGLPAITLPVHQTVDGLPMGVQLIGRPGREDVLLALGAQLERRIGWGVGSRRSGEGAWLGRGSRVAGLASWGAGG